MGQIKVKKAVSEGMAKELKSKLGEERFAILQRIWDAYNYLVDEGKVNTVAKRILPRKSAARLQIFRDLRRAGKVCLPKTCL